MHANNESTCPSPSLHVSIAFLLVALQNYTIYLYGADTLILQGGKVKNNFNFHAFMKRHS